MLHPIWKKDTAALLFLRDSRAFFHKVAWRGKITKTCPSGLGKCWQRTGMKLSYMKLLQSSSAYSITLSIMGSYMDAVLVPDGYHPRTTTSSLLGTIKNPCYILKSLSVVTPSASAWPIFAKPNLPRVLAVIIKCSTSSLLIYLGWSSCLSWLDPAFERNHNSGFLGYIRKILVEGWPGQWGSLTNSFSLADIEEKSECHTLIYSRRAA